MSKQYVIQGSKGMFRSLFPIDKQQFNLQHSSRSAAVEYIIKHEKVSEDDIDFIPEFKTWARAPYLFNISDLQKMFTNFDRLCEKMGALDRKWFDYIL